MKKETTKAVNEQGLETERKTERRVQLTLPMLEELAYDEPLLAAFTRTILENPEMKAPIAYQFAKAQVKQQKLAI